ncbi:glycerol-3-phosphate dehydrogenase [Acidithiobacillus montserratensis]|uniref:Glycerol-3-phosphate dehydrogenase n=1 Tax=Acidithiobacillus montserratensis TaxID=2729135 RepID=A0ACD5HFZ6_9PROT|nr:glycerol-3-phosphate dehydrogenase [Acidithiobacillus montserratensis]MBN2680012.1 glycerol-3-phosphate dehydrogenase [Acidithiobacillaceae bacterium]MBU2748506.1 glycerol-3-phosphate dehydrogenase [Acidithiobacillus montserratensis]
MSEPFDLLIIGGGINGVGIARDASGRKLSVLLVEQDDLAAHTSSASTKLIHGGLRYLEYYEFRLVREALMERERLLGIAPHIIWPLEFVLPQGPDSRSSWRIRAGLFLYDHLAPRSRLPASRAVHFGPHPAVKVLKPAYTQGFTYADCWVEDSRLVALNALDAAERGAKILTRTQLLSAHPENQLWAAQLLDKNTGQQETVHARALINAAGPWVGSVLSQELGIKTQKTVRKVKGSHIIVPRLYEGDYAFILQNPDRRIIFTIPYEYAYTLIGTTDIPYDGDPAEVHITAEETAYLCESVSRYFQKPVEPDDVVRSYAGVRPLYDDHAANASAVTRDYVLDMEGGGETPPLLSVFGGKITTYRRLAEHALSLLQPALGHPKDQSWTANAPLPGGDIPAGDFSGFVRTLSEEYAFLPEHLAYRLARAYGTRTRKILGNARQMIDLGQDFGGGLTQAEVDYLVTQEWARQPEDILWRRSKMALHVPEDTVQKLETYLHSLEGTEKIRQGGATTLS